MVIAIERKISNPSVISDIYQENRLRIIFTLGPKLCCRTRSIKLELMALNRGDLIESGKSLLKNLLSKKAIERDQAWEYVYKTYYPMVRELIQKNSGTDEDATDIFQDGLLVLHRNISNGSFREESSIKTYLYSICKNLWLKELERRARRATSSLDFLNDPTMRADTTDDLGYLIDTQVIELLISELQEDCRNILIEYYYNNRSMAELKKIFNVGSIQAAKNKKWRCMGYL